MENKITEIVNDLKKNGLTSHDIQTWLDTINFPHSEIIAHSPNDTVIKEMIEMLTPCITKLLTVISTRNKTAPMLSSIARDLEVEWRYQMMYADFVYALARLGYYQFEDGDDYDNFITAVSVKTQELAKIQFPNFVLN
jgi:hypothetical protein